MKTMASSIPGGGFPAAAGAIAGRELRTLLRNRFIHVFSVLSLIAGLGTVAVAPSAAAIPFVLLQITLTLVPLFGILVGLSSAHAELEEHPFLLSQPAPRFAIVTGKLAALTIAMSGVLLPAFLPALLQSARPQPLALLGGLGLVLALVFIAFGLAIGFSTRERSRGIIYALLAWLVVLGGFDLVAYAAASLPAMREHPAAWLAILLSNPIDTLRIAMLFELEDIPFNVPAEWPWLQTWMDRLLGWFVLLCGIWTAALLLWCRRQLERLEV